VENLVLQLLQSHYIEYLPGIRRGDRHKSLQN
jgi:hypothetical protein